MTPTEVDQPAEAVTTTDANSAAATTQPRRSLRLLKNQKSQVTTTSSLRAEPRQPRAPRPVDPIQRRKKAWPHKWETWRIESVAAQLSMSDAEAVERLRNTLDNLWKSDPEQASIYEDALVIFDEKARAAQLSVAASPEAGPSLQYNNMASPEAEAPSSDVVTSAPEIEALFQQRDVASADLEASLTLMSLRYGGNAQGYINYGATDGSMGLRAFNSTSVQVDAPNHQSLGITRSSTRAKGKQPATHRVTNHGHLNASPLRVSTGSVLQTWAPAVSHNNHDTLDSNLKHADRISKSPSTISRVVRPSVRPTRLISNVIPATPGFHPTQPSVVEGAVNKAQDLPTTLRQSKRKSARDSEDEDYTISLTEDTPATSKMPSTNHKKAKTTKQSPILLRSKRKVVRIEDDEESSPEKANKEFNITSNEEGTQTRLLRLRSKRKIVYVSDDEDEAPYIKKKNTTGSKKAKTEETMEKSPFLRRTERKSTRFEKDGDADFSPPDDNPQTPKTSKNDLKKSSTNEDEDDEDDEVAIVKKPKQATKKSDLALVHPPNNLPLKAPTNAPGIPNGALALNEHFKKDTPVPLGVQLPVNRTRTRWEWIPYNTRKNSNANFDWADDQQRKDANRFRQQRIRRRLTEHGYIYDGRKNH